MNVEDRWFGTMIIGKPNETKGFVCSVRLEADDGLFGSIDLDYEGACIIAMELLRLAGDFSLADLTRETSLGARH